MARDLREDAELNTHYALVVFSGDPDEEHPDPALRGRGPHVEMVACGTEAFCWDAIARWTARHPLQMWQTAEVVVRDPSTVRVPG